MEAATTSMPTLRGRDAELAAVGVQLDRARSGVGAVVLVEGDPGMGKSWLLHGAARIAGRMSFRVGSGAAEPVESVVELAPLMDALFDGEAPLLERGALRAVHALPEQRYWLMQDIQALLERAALKQPLLVCLDDLQWADSGTAAAVRALPTRLAALPIAWMIACRPGERSAQLTGALDYLEREGAERIVLGPLDDEAVAQIAGDVIHAEPGDALLELLTRAHGSPFIVAELLSGLRDEELVRVDSGQAELVEDRLPRRVGDSMRERLRGMSQAAREAAFVAGSLGRRFSFGDLATMLDRPPSALLSPVEELMRSGVVIECGEQLAFRHDITRDAVRASLPVSARRALDRQAADVLLAAGATPVEVATQLAASAERGDERAIATLFKAAEAVAMSDPGRAADLSRRALELAPRKHPLRGALAAQTALMLHEAARVDEARAFVDTSLREALPSKSEAEVRLSIAGMFAVSPEVRVDAGRKALALPDVPPDLRARHLACLVHNLMVGGHAEAAHAVLPEARAAVNSSGDSNAAFMLHLAQAGLETVGGRYARALEATEAAARAGAATHDYARERLAQEWRCELMAVLDRPEEAVKLAADGIAEARRDHQGWALHIFESWRGRQLLQAGRLQDAAAILEGQFSPEQDDRQESILDVAGVVALGRIAIHLGDARLKRVTAAFARGLVDHGPPSFRRQAAWILALQAIAAGDAPAARHWLCAFGEEGRTAILPLFPPEVTDDTHLVRIAIAANDLELATSAATTAERRSELNPDVRTIAGTAAHARGLVAGDDELLAQAVEFLTDGPRPLALASAVEDLGVARARSGSNEGGIAALERALGIYAQCGAAWDAGRVRSRLRAHGVRRRLVNPEREEAGWAAMTDSELAVARLVAQGLTNREVAEQLFVSPHTVSSHLRRVFAKLDINSRVDLTRLAGEHERQL